ncbi:MAG: hypothetical protein HY200_04295 [Nitrospirae bacterium]|nr:hypothetical protein [Nitrospirota bacterium]MBI3594155.1 hypothetical protein [Nitrospirota bacterium]
MKTKKGKSSAKSSLDPMAVARLSSAYWSSKVIHTAVRLDVFNHLGSQSKTAAVLAEECDADVRGLEILLIAAVSLGLLDRSSSGKYKNTLLSKTFLVKNSPKYQGGIPLMFEEWYPTWGRLYDAVLTGKPVVEKPHEQGDESTRAYIMGMHYRGLAQAHLLAKRVPLKGRKQFFDVAGGPGIFTIMMCKVNKNLKGIVFDTPQTLKITREIIENYKIADRVKTREGDYFRDDFGEGNDVVLLSSMLNQESPEMVKTIMRKGYQSLEKGGLLIAQDQMLNPNKTGPLLSALIGVNQLLHTPGGAAHSEKEIAQWMKEVGFTRVSRVDLKEPSPFTVLTGIK